MLRSNTSLSKGGMKFSTQMEGLNFSFREGRESETSDMHDGTQSVLRRVNSPGRNLGNELSASTRLSRRSSNQPRGAGTGGERSQLSRMVTQLKEEYAAEARLSRYSNLVKAKSEHNFAKSEAGFTPVSKGKPEERGKSSLAELQQKISQYNKSSRLVTVKSESRLLEQARSPERSAKLSEKTQKCRQLCLEIKRKLFKETVSTTTSDAPRKALSISDFRLEKLIGEGKFSKVYIARRSGVILAVKVIKKETIKKENFLDQLVRQLKIQSFLAHVNLVKLYSFFHDSLNIYLLLEFCAGGQLYDLFRVKSKLREEEWQPLMKGVCEGLLELHRHGVIHRDLKPENIVLSFGIPKIGDFGWSVYSSTDKRETFCGTPLYISPELLLGSAYDRQVDIWALGVMMYEFLTGRIPFKIQHENNLLEIVNSTIVYPKFLSDDCLALMRLILEKDPASRIAILDILEHPFLNKNLQSSPPYNLFKISR